MARSAGEIFLGGMVLDLRCKQDTAGHGVVHDAVLARRGAPEKKNRVPESLQIPYNFLLKTNEKCAQPAKTHDGALRNSKSGSAGPAFEYSRAVYCTTKNKQKQKSAFQEASKFFTALFRNCPARK